ncbi:MAG: hypothetical protein ACI9CO_001606 [Candidatus Azotimanducaceae bacterium]
MYGDQLKGLDPNDQLVNTVIQSYSVFPHMPIAQNIGFGLKIKGESSVRIASVVEKMLSLVKMETFGDRIPNQLSSRQQQRIALLRALAPKPKVLLLDEPLSALNLKLRQAMRLKLKQLQKETGIQVNVDTYDGPDNFLKEFFEPNDSVSGKIQVFKSPNEVILLALMYLGHEQCNENPEDMKEVLALLLKQKSQMKAYNYESMVANLVSGEVMVSRHRDGYSMKTRLRDGVMQLKYVHPKKGIIRWFYSLVIPKSAPNKANAEKFTNFMMYAKNGAAISNFNRYTSLFDGKTIAAFIDPVLATAPEINLDLSIPVYFSETCSGKSIKLYDRVWTKTLLQTLCHIFITKF